MQFSVVMTNTIFQSALKFVHTNMPICAFQQPLNKRQEYIQLLNQYPKIPDVSRQRFHVNKAYCCLISTTCRTQKKSWNWLNSIKLEKNIYYKLNKDVMIWISQNVSSSLILASIKLLKGKLQWEICVLFFNLGMLSNVFISLWQNTEQKISML